MSLQHHSIKQAYDLPVGTEVTLHGWVRSRRDSKGVTFIELNDGSRFKSMQLVVDAGVVSEERFHLCADAHHYHLGLRGGGTNVQRDFVECA